MKEKANMIHRLQLSLLLSRTVFLRMELRFLQSEHLKITRSLYIQKDLIFVSKSQVKVLGKIPVICRKQIWFLTVANNFSSLAEEMLFDFFILSEMINIT